VAILCKPEAAALMTSSGDSEEAFAVSDIGNHGNRKPLDNQFPRSSGFPDDVVG
jgi:hypothetical protein